MILESLDLLSTAERLRTPSMLSSGQERASSPDAVRDRAAHGADSRYALAPDEVVARSSTSGTATGWLPTTGPTWSAVSHDRVGGDVGRFVQAPLSGEEDAWPFDSDFRSDTAVLEPRRYYPTTLSAGAAGTD